MNAEGYVGTNVYLVGYMGSGKSTFGKKLAKKLGWEFIDLDQYIETTTQRTIAELFAQGEEAFRRTEAYALQQMVFQVDTVIALGGGAFCSDAAVQFVNKQGLSIYLQLPVASLVQRLTNANAQRPLIAGKSEEELHAFIAEHLQTREPFYEQAHLTIDGHGMNAVELDAFVARLRKDYFK